MNGFKQFILRGNVVDLAVGVVIGAAFTTVVNAVVTGIISPLIGLFGSGNFDSYQWDVYGNDQHVFYYGRVATAVLSFLITAAVVYFLVVRPVNLLTDKFLSEPDVKQANVTCAECLSSIPSGARRCAFCTAEQPDAAATAVSQETQDGEATAQRS